MSTIQHSDQSYRSGLVLGFTMAEISILITFVLLLVLSVLFGRKSKEVEELKQRIAILEPNTSKELIRLKKLEQEFNSARPADTQEQSLPEVFRELVLVRQKIVDAGIKPKPNALQLALEESALAQKALAAMGGQGAVALTQEITQLDRENTNLKAQMANLRRQARIGGRGLDHPPCWATPEGRPEYIFDVALTSQGLMLRDRVIPHNRLYELDNIPVDALVFGKELTPIVFTEMTKPLFDWSAEQIPECRFVVRVFDTTGPTEKALYKHHMRVLEHHFYKYEAVKEKF